ncbi:Lsr2-like briding protein [Streptomyces phage Rana]|uniref:Lsr2-like briding protein n=1 Tax=Streptomyces phage Lorelei TaxID=1873996 RepID=A0A1C9LWL7_9CAUD|nr:Lsr2-like DNA bridging protein [Streptomyces phage Lorelei]AOQ26972.1 Lsr2-like briding protein [Streptomyces phage Lorelei]AWN07267.1 Lsr2-like briding protein [Streptomyces phage Rana]AWN07343.1 Lsr2-like briding protein [Streptomyces phage Nabi]
MLDMKRTIITLVDDLDGRNEARTVTFGLDGATYEIDLCEKNEARLRKALDKYVLAGRKVKGKKRATSTRSGT